MPVKKYYWIDNYSLAISTTPVLCPLRFTCQPNSEKETAPQGKA